MNVQFRETASIAYETMPPNRRKKADSILQRLANDQLRELNPAKLKNGDTWVVRVDSTARLLFKKTDQGFLIIDIIDLAREGYSAHTA